jgi:hypothetical protein
VPGRTLVDANDAFISPIKAALGLLGPLQLVQSNGARRDEAGSHTWTINSGQGVRVGQLHLQAAMIFGYRRDSTHPGTPWRATTKAYEYKILRRDGGEILVWHWQPGGPGPEFPHIVHGTRRRRRHS